MEQGIKIRLYPNKEQQFMINKLLGCYRFVYNQGLEYSIKMYKSEKAIPTLKNLGHYFHNELTKDDNYSWLCCPALCAASIISLNCSSVNVIIIIAFKSVKKLNHTCGR